MTSDDLLKGFEFTATLQMRTPLRILLKHRTQRNLNAKLPNFAPEGWEGIWMPVLKTWSELGGKDLFEFVGPSATDIGPVENRGYEYWRFLVAIKSAANTRVPYEQRRALAEAEAAKEEWARFVCELGGPSGAAAKALSYR
ncbi:MAG TPA: hypothetical protein VGM81_26505 [Burkholderiaceae bacterium]|jgi:hypothetical protein